MGWIRLSRFIVPACLLAVLLQSHLASAISAQPEYKLKAAFLINFTKFVVWPAQALPEGIAITICIVGMDPFGLVLDNGSVPGQAIDNHPLVIKRISVPAALHTCHVAFISSAETVAEVLPLLRNLPVLTVSDTEEFLQQGGMINFINDSKNISFEVNLPVVRKAGITISSKLLALARSVIMD